MPKELKRVIVVHYDTSVCLGCKAHLRNNKPVLIAVSTNDALGISAKSIANLLNTKNIYFVPMGQDSPTKKPNSVVADFKMIPKAVEDALNNVQTQPLLIQY